MSTATEDHGLAVVYATLSQCDIQSNFFFQVEILTPDDLIVFEPCAHTPSDVPTRSQAPGHIPFGGADLRDVTASNNAALHCSSAYPASVDPMRNLAFGN